MISICPFKPQKLMFTRIDETDQIGTLIETAVSTGLPVSFLSNGPRVPEDLEPANASQLARRIFLRATLFATGGGRVRAEGRGLTALVEASANQSCKWVHKLTRPVNRSTPNGSG